MGHFIPSLSKTSLWELESDYHLHNKLLRPPPSYADKILCSQEKKYAELEASNGTIVGHGSFKYQYVVKTGVDSSVAQEIINRKEQRKKLHREKMTRVEEALQVYLYSI